MTSTMQNAAPTSAVAPELPRAVVLGDSQAEGLAPHLRGALAPLFYVVNTIWQRGISTRALIRSGKIEAALAQRPAVVMFVLGGNDTASDSYRQDLIDAVALAARDGARVIWVGPAYSLDPVVERRHAAAREAQRALLPTLGVLWLDSVAWTRAGHADDDVHFTRVGYAAQATAIAVALEARRTEVLVASRGSSTSPLIVGAVAAAALAVGLGVWAATRA